MVFPVVGGTQSTGYEIDNSLRFNDNDTAYLNRTRSSQSNTTGTFSVWTKMGNPGADNILFGGHTDVNNRSYIYFSDPDGYVGIFSRTSGSADIAYNSNGRFRDPSAWYHVVVAIDTTDGTAGNRFKMYINGTQYTDWGTATAPSQNASLPILNQAAQTVGGGYGSSAVSAMAEGYMADAYYIDGQQKAASDFGETDDNGVWIPKKYDGTYGTNGFKLEFQQTGTGTASASTIGADTSGEDNHLTSNNLAATDVTVDTPTNNFCTWNPLIGRAAAYATFAEGNLDADFTSGSVYYRATGSIGVTSGKWYAEIKCIDDGGNTDLKIGVEHASPDQTTIDGVHKVIQSWNGHKASGGSASSFGDSYADGDIVGVLLDMDNGTIKFSKNGTMMASSASAYTDLISAMPESGWAFFAYGYDDANVQANFGNAPFSISSGNADANGYGNFEYAVPNGYYALCTKNLATYG